MEGQSETCRVLLQNKINLRFCASGWFQWIDRLELFVSQSRFEVDLSMRVSISACATLLLDLSTYGVYKGQISSLVE
jgi:hypothetical protein